MVSKPGSAAAGRDGGEARCGTVRASMRTNVLVAKTELGKVKRTTFNDSPPDRVCGAPHHADAEGAREITSAWREHVPNSHARPGPDFCAMNAAAADSGLVSSGEVREFRRGHPQALRDGAAARPPPRLPSAADPAFAYGLPPGYRSSEDVRNFGPSEPPMKQLVQGAYSQDWVRMNEARKEEFDVRRRYVKPTATAATRGHAQGAAATIARAAAGSPEGGGTAAAAAGGWKMPRFEATAAPRVTKYMA